MTKLNPCPECGNEPNINVLDDNVNICCGRCDSSDEYLVMSRSASGAINAWNAATGEQPAKTLRDEFAMMAHVDDEILEAAIMSSGKPLNIVTWAEYTARIKYLLADAMLKERNK